MRKQCKPKPCSECKIEFQPMNSLTVVCSYKCAAKRVTRINERKHAIALKKAESAAKSDIRARKVALKSKSDWLRECQVVFNKFIRLRDKGVPCISCGKGEAELKINNPISMVCGHYLSVGAHPEKRFIEFNANLQCTRCNGGAGKYGKFNSKELTVTKQYRINLIKKIGQKNVDVLEGLHEAKHYTIDDIKELKAEYQRKIKGLML